MKPTLGRYALTEAIGAGGAGRVYRGVMSGPGGFRREVAVKVLYQGADTLEREARLGGLLRHRNLVDVYEVGEQGGQWFAAMEYCEGGSLRGWAPLPPRAVVEVGLQVCEALQYAHEALGLVHLDIKPANLLLKDGVVKVADLGIARARGFPGAGRLSGTPAFMAPEQRRGGPTDTRTDIYALGVTLAVLATGRLADADALFSAASEATNERARSQETVDFDAETWSDPRATSPLARPSLFSRETVDLDADAQPATGADDRTAPRIDAPTWLLPVLARCLSPSPDGRFDDMADLARALRALDAPGSGLRAFIGWSPPRPPERSPHTNLIPAPDTFIGRADALGALAGALDEGGLVTLTGPAGVGKSRLAAEAARRWRAQRDGQVWRVALSQAQDTHALIAAAAVALQVPLGRGEAETLVETLGHAIAGRGPVVLILDDFDRLAALAPVVARWRAAAPQARLITTSRQPLLLDDEQVIALPPLSPTDARALLVDRARRRGADLADDPDLDALVARLDGLPLAIELAAGRLGVLSVRDVLDRLGLSLLRRGDAGRHGTLQAALDWSWELLDAPARAALAQCSVFADGFTLEAAEAVVDLSDLDGAPWVIEVVQTLVDRSMLRALGGNAMGEARFGAYQSVRAYAASKLREPGPAEARHGAHFAGLCAPQALALLSAAEGTRRWWALQDERSNLAAATRRATSRGDVPAATAAALGLAALVGRQGPFSVAVEAIQGALAMRDRAGVEDNDTARLLNQLALLELDQGALDDADAHARQALAMHARFGDRRGEGAASVTLGFVHTFLFHPEQSVAYSQRALELFREDGHPRGQAQALGVLGSQYLRQNLMEQADAAHREALAIYARHGSPQGEASIRNRLGILHHHRGELELAQAHFSRALDLVQRIGDRRHEAKVLGNLGMLRAAQGDLDEALGFFQRSLGVHRALGNRRGAATSQGNVGIVYRLQGRHQEALTQLEAALEVHLALRNLQHAGVLLESLGELYREVGQPERAIAYHQRSLEIARQIGDVLGEGSSLGHLGEIAFQRGDRARGLSLMRQGAARMRDAQAHKDLGPLLAALGQRALEAGYAEEAQAALREILSLAPDGQIDPEGELGRGVAALREALAAAE